jgi:hypothetical protein
MGESKKIVFEWSWGYNCSKLPGVRRVRSWPVAEIRQERRPFEPDRDSTRVGRHQNADFDAPLRERFFVGE